jgi:ATP-dependent Clp protease ATP-binding subunit ClpA
MHTASAQLLGSGRGIVGSYEAGRLEKISKHHAGAVIEVSDLDHAVPSVRSGLADLFLQALETGQAQSARGGMFSCASTIFAFTMNLPEGADERIRKGLGFQNTPSKKEVIKRVIDEIKQMVSSAFLSRIGLPILFAPLEGDTLAIIVEGAVKQAVLSASDRFGNKLSEVVIEDGIGAKVVASLEINLTAFGARALLEQGRSLAAAAYIRYINDTRKTKHDRVRVSFSNGKLVLKAVQ